MNTEPEALGPTQPIDEGWTLYEEGRYADALRAAEEAWAEARHIGDVGLQVRAAHLDAAALSMLGRMGDALTRYSWILGVAEDPAYRSVLAIEKVAFVVVTAFIHWAESALYLPAMQVNRLFEVLDAGDRFVRAIGKPAWRAGILQMRANVLRHLRRVDEAIDYAEEGLMLQSRERRAPGATLDSHRWALGDLLRETGRFDDARRLYHAVLDDDEGHPGDCFAALRGLVRCCLAVGDNAAARRLAEEAVRSAGSLGDDALRGALGDLTDTCLAQGDLATARAASDRHVDLARRLGIVERLFFAYYRAAKVALAERDALRIRAVLSEAQPHAEALDRARNRNYYRAMVDKLRARLAALDPPPAAA